jgi:hypothetical protein
MTNRELSEQGLATALERFFKDYVTEGDFEEARAIAESHVDNAFRVAIAKQDAHA